MSTFDIRALTKHMGSIRRTFNIFQKYKFAIICQISVRNEAKNFPET